MARSIRGSAMAADVALAASPPTKRPRSSRSPRRSPRSGPRSARTAARCSASSSSRSIVADRDLRRLHRAAFADRAVPRRGARAAGLGRGRLVALRARHRRRRARHAVAADLRRARFAVHRRLGDERLVRGRRRARPARPRSAGSIVDVVDHPRHGPDHGGAEPGAGDPRRRRARARASPTRSSR